MRLFVKRWMTVLLAACLLALGAAGAMASGVTLRTFTPFADVDFAAQGFMDLITAWEAETGNVAEDYSGIPDESWMEQLKGMAAAGEADIVVLPVGSGLSVGELVTAGELEEAAALGVKKFASMKESDGSLLLAPLRLNWEALYVNLDVMQQYGLSAPATFGDLLAACAVLRESGVTPIANALGDWPEIVLDCAALAGADEALYGKQASLNGAKDVLAALLEVGAFGVNPWEADDLEMEEKFLSGEAAMRIDADALAQLVDEARTDSVVVVPVPGKDGRVRTKIVGTPAFGLSLTRACWNDPARKEAALSLAAKMLSDEGMAALCAPVGGKLGQSIVQLVKKAGDCAGILYDLNPDTFDAWAEDVVDALAKR